MKLSTETKLLGAAAVSIVGGFWLLGKLGTIVGEQLRAEFDERVDQALPKIPPAAKPFLPFPFNLIP